MYYAFQSEKIAAPQVHIVDYSTVYAKSLDFFKKYCIIIIAIRFRNTKLKVYYSETGAGDGTRTDDDARPPRRAAESKVGGRRSMQRAP